ncbi:exo-1,3-beta-D-glucanase [Xylaria venustula]|nr:exo-1,3-beta-D-glucanase [Xylaria venustula]
MLISRLPIYAFLGILHISLTLATSATTGTYVRHQRLALEKRHIYRRSNVTDSGSRNVSSTALAEAQKFIAPVVAQQGIYNAYRIENPRRNNYYAENRPHPASAARKRKRSSSEPVQPVLNSTVRAAAALLAEHHAAQQAANGSLHKIYQQPTMLKQFVKPSGNRKRDSSEYWLGLIEHNGLAPMGQNSSWVVYRDVTDPMFAGGAKGDGVTDDTAAINAAISYGGNCGDGCLSSSIKGTLVYFPPGTYLISTPIEAYYYSQLVGNPNDLPIIKTSPSFVGLGAIETDVYEPNSNGDEWYINQSNFYRQVRNFVIDIQDTTTASVAGLHWQVAQATSLTNVFIYASTSSDTTAMGMFTENGSSGFMGECFFYGGKYGLYGGNQQYTVRSFEFVSQTKASICLIWDWGWTWSQLSIHESPIGIYLINPEDPDGQQAGSIYVMDSEFVNVGNAIYANSLPATILGSSVITLDNIGVIEVSDIVAFSDGSKLDLPNTNVDFVIIGNIEADGSDYGMYSIDVNNPSPQLTITPGFTEYRENYFFKSRPQYEDIEVSDIVDVKTLGAKGDGVTDDTAIIAKAFAMATSTNLVYFPAGSYIITKTLTMNSGTRITGEVWSQLVAYGDFFANETDPQPMLQVGLPGDTGIIEISDMLFTSIGALPGLVLVQWNIAADEQGSAALWDAHFRLGGADGTKLQVSECPMGAAIQESCIAASMMLHIPSWGNGYFENMWAWIADHDLDDPQNTMITVACARGILVESNGPTWLYGTASEHAVLYQYNFYESTNVWAGMIQTESPYFQYTADAESPAVFNSSIGIFSNDPVFPDDTCTADDLLCNFSWAVIIQATTNLTIAGAGLYSWFDNYDQSVCVDAQNCQQRLLNNQGYNDQLYVFNLVTIGSVEMLSDTDTGDVIYAANNTQATAHPFWSILGSYLDDSSTEPHFCDDDDTDPSCFVTPTCDYSLSYATMDDLEAASGSWPSECFDFYMLGTLNFLLSDALNNYTSANDGYDALWKYYVDSVKGSIPGAIKLYMAQSSKSNPAGGPGNKFFKCDYLEVTGPSYTANPCPIPYSDISPYFYEYKITYTLLDSDGFFDGIRTAYGLEQDWIVFGTQGGVTTSVCAPDPDPGSPNVDNLDKRCDELDYSYVNYPVMSNNVTVTNPKDVITAALPSLGNLQTTITARQQDLILGQWTGPTDDLLQVVSMPVFLIVQAVQAMQADKEEAEKEKKQEEAEKEKKQEEEELIIEILSIIFAFIPFLEEIAPALDSLDVAIEVLDIAGNAGLTIQSIVADPSSAPFEILGALAGGIFKDDDAIGRLAAARRAISSNDLSKIGAKFEALDAQMQRLIKGKGCA